MAFGKSISYNYKDILATEIALDGLQGIGLNLLWKRVEKRLAAPVTLKLKTRYWDFIASNDTITLYLQKEPLKEIVILDRFTIVDEDSGHLINPPDYVDGIYEYCPVKDEYGSCTNYEKRKRLPKSDIENMTYVDIETKYGNRLVMVASIEERWRALASHLPISYLTLLTPVHYCILELIGRARENGQMTVGKTNLTKIVSESKLLFYNRKHLIKLDLIKVLFITQIVGGKSMKTLLLRINKYHKPTLLTLPKTGRVYNMVSYLLKEPGFCERTEMMIKKGFMTSKHSKRLQKTFNIFCFEEKPVEYKEKKNKSGNIIKRKFMCLNQASDDDESEDEDQTPPLKCQYKVGIGLMRQAYERFLDAGQKGLTQIEMAQLLGVEFYTSRSICRTLKAKRIIREFLEDKGRQRTARYVAITAQKDDIDEKYAAEKKKFLKHLNDTKKAVKSSNKRSAEESCDSKSKVPKKKVKQNKEETETTENAIVEADSLSGLEGVQASLINAKKDLTLRQLMFANGMLKVIKDKQFVTGYQTLGTLVSKETGQPSMDTKGLKLFIQKLVTDKQLKILKIKWPGPDKKYSYLICAPHVKATDPIIKAKYKEICSKAQATQKSKGRSDDSQSMSKMTYPRYMKIQKLHEHITQLVYFNEVKKEGLPLGFSTLFSIIPEMTVEYALGAITFISKSDPANIRVDKEVLRMKLKDAPKEVVQSLMHSKSLHNSIRLALKMLATLGLIQIIAKPSPLLATDDTVLFYVFYVNRHAKILDTSGKWPRCEDMKTLEKSFYFETFDDVQNYWEEVRNISLYTVVTVTARERCKLEFPVRTDHEVHDHDVGERFGDGMGPCGFDSSIFMDMPRLWNTLMTRCHRKVSTSVARPKKKVIRKGKPRNVAAGLKNPGMNYNRIKQEMDADGTVHRRLLASKSKDLTWSPLEDKIITICKAAIKVISPVQLSGSLTVRNLVAKDLVCLIDPQKNSSAVHKRSIQLESNMMWKHLKERVLCELRRRRNVIKEYDGLLKIAKEYNSSYMSKLINDARLPMLELVWFILQMEKNKTIRDEYECVAKDINDFNKRFTIALTSEAQDVGLYKTPPSEELQFGALKEAIITSVMLSEKTITKAIAQKLYMLFKNFPEIVLRSAIEQLRKGGAIVPREKTSFINKGTFDTISQSAFKVSAVYRRKWISRLNVEFFKDLASILKSEVPTVGLKGNSELNCFLCELQGCDAGDIYSDSVPVVTGSVGSIILEEQMNVIDMETKYKLKSGHLGWKNKMNLKCMSELYKKVNLDSIFKTMSRNCIFHLKTYSWDRNNEILSYLDGMGFKGCTFNELQEHLSIDSKLLTEKLSELSSKGIIKAIGYFQNVIMLAKYTKPFLLEIRSNTYLEPTPWVNLGGKIQEDAFFKWACVILNKIFECPGISITGISDHLECISCRGVLNVCTFLEKCECAILKTMQPKEVDLFSDDEDVYEENEFNPYCSFENIYVYPVKNCLTKFSLIINQNSDDESNV